MKRRSVCKLMYKKVFSFLVSRKKECFACFKVVVDSGIKSISLVYEDENKANVGVSNDRKRRKSSVNNVTYKILLKVACRVLLCQKSKTPFEPLL